jgi:hypothetical protein
LSELRQVEHAIGHARRPEPVASSRPLPSKPSREDESLEGWEELAVLAAREEQILHELRRRSLIDLAGAS